MKLCHRLFIVSILCSTNSVYAEYDYYTRNDLDSLGCTEGMKTCLFEAIAEDWLGGLYCRSAPSLKARLVETVLKGDKVLWKKLEWDERGHPFFLVEYQMKKDDSTTCYIRATRNRLTPINQKAILSSMVPNAERAQNSQESKGNIKFQQSVQFKRACEAGKNYTIVTVGDILLHSALQEQATKYQDFKPLWTPFLSCFQQADMAYANLEAPTAQGVNKFGENVIEPGHTFDGIVYSSYPQFNYHASLISDLLDSGFDVVSTANNHSLDRRSLGIERTIDALEKQGLSFTGTRRKGETTQVRPWSTIVEKNGLRIAWIACTYGTNGIPDKYHQVLHCFDPQDKPVMLAEIRKHSQHPDIDAVFVTPHWGTEYQTQPNSTEIALGKEFLEAGALAVIGNHPHVQQPMQKYTTRDGRETFIIYSLGNFVSNQGKVRRRAAIILFVGLTKNKKEETFLNGVKFLPAIMNNYTEANHYQLAPSKPQDAINQKSYKHILSVLNKAHQVTYGDFVVTNDHCQNAR